jgi:hypothetical protein
MPTPQQYGPERVPFIGEMLSRNGTPDLDQRFQNVVFEKVENSITQASKTYLHKRGGLVPAVFTTIPPGEARGIFFWNGDVYSVYGSLVFKNTLSIFVLNTTTGKVGFDLTLDSGPTKLIISDGASLYLIEASGIFTLLSQVNFAHVSQPIALDGYIFLVDLDGRIRNSEVNNPFLWNALGVIKAVIDADKIVKLVRHKNQLVAIGETTIEYFYNAGEPPPGSPLLRTQQAIEDVGAVSFDSITNKESLICFVSASKTGAHQVILLNNYNKQIISTQPIDRILEDEEALIKNCRAVCFRHKGSLLYVLTLSNRTLVYNLTEKIWCEWTFANQPFDFRDTAFSTNSVYLQSSSSLLPELQGVYTLEPNVYIDTINTDVGLPVGQAPILTSVAPNRSLGLVGTHLVSLSSPAIAGTAFSVNDVFATTISSPLITSLALAVSYNNGPFVPITPVLNGSPVAQLVPVGVTSFTLQVTGPISTPSRANYTLSVSPSVNMYGARIDAAGSLNAPLLIS